MTNPMLDSGTNPPADSGTMTGQDAATNNDTGVMPASSKVRIAHLSPDAPAVDACVKKSSDAAWPATPLLESLGGAAGLSYPEVTAYVDLPAGTYDLRVVAATAKDCSTSIVPDTNGVAVPGNIRATIAATGLAGGMPGFGLVVFVDEGTVANGKAKLRFVHASPGTPAVDVGLGSGNNFTPVFKNVAFREKAAIGANGYLETDPIANGTISARATGTTTDALVIPGVSVPANAIVTAFAIGQLQGKQPLKVRVCVDSAPPKGLLSDCVTVP